MSSVEEKGGDDGVLHVFLELDKEDEFLDQKIAIIVAHNIRLEFFLTEIDPLPLSLLTALRIRALNMLDLYFYDDDLSSGSLDHTVPIGMKFVSPQNERKMLIDCQRLLKNAGSDQSLSSAKRGVLESAMTLLCSLCNQFIQPLNSRFALDDPCIRDDTEDLFRDWLTREHFPRSLSVAQFPGIGRGLIATKAFAPGEVVLSIPKDLIINIDTALSSPLGAVFAEVLKLFPDMHQDTITLLFALYQRHDPTSRWAEYFELAPKEYTTLLTFSEDELSLLAGTPLPAHREENMTRLRTVYEELFPILSDRYPDVFRPDVFTWENWLWCRCLFDTRAFEPEIQGVKKTSLLPFADMMNHSPYAQIVTPRFDDATQCIHFEALGDIPQGAQLHLNYGRLQNWELLTYYGFVDTTCPYDVYRLDLEPPDDEMATQKALILAHSQLPLQHYIDRDGHLHKKLLGALRVLLLTEEEMLHLPDGLAMAASGMFSKDNELNVCQTLQATLEAVLHSLDNSLEEDEAMLHMTCPIRVLLALQYRVTQKQILHKALGEVQNLLSTLTVL